MFIDNWPSIFARKCKKEKWKCYIAEKNWKGVVNMEVSIFLFNNVQMVFWKWKFVSCLVKLFVHIFYQSLFIDYGPPILAKKEKWQFWISEKNWKGFVNIEGSNLYDYGLLEIIILINQMFSCSNTDYLKLFFWWIILYKCSNENVLFGYLKCLF